MVTEAPIEESQEQSTEPSGEPEGEAPGQGSAGTPGDPAPRAERPKKAKAPQQTMKPMKAAKKLGIHLPATPESFRDALTVTRSELARLVNDPPDWLTELRRTGPHPREVVASRLGISIAGLVRGGAGEALLTTEIEELRQEPPAWLVRERANMARVRAEEERLAAGGRETPRAQPAGRRPTSA